jgi:D-beta-D-heptose 7-phosphate kinase/D-beta-D-heptose 1-phosphate adenosyltransferase
MKQRILVIGDSCKDIFVYCAVNRLCPEVPVPILKIRESTENGGMSMNVQRNFQALGVDCDICTNWNWANMTKSRYVHRESNHMFLRIDTDDEAAHIDIDKVNYDYDAVVISDYNKGFLNPNDIETICHNHPMVFLDTKKILGPWAEKAHYIKINHTEFTNSRPYMSDTLLSKTIHTMGGNGAELNGVLYPVEPVEVKDASGAGDTFMAGLVTSYLNTKDIGAAINFANSCARKVVQHRGVVTV